METMREITVNVNGVGDMDAFQVASPESRVGAHGHDLVVTAGEDGMIFVTDVQAETVVHEVVVSDGTIVSIAVTPEQTHLVLACEEDNSVYTYKMPPQFDMDQLVYRSTVAIRQVACCNKFIAIADEEQAITLVLRGNTEQLIKVSGHEQPIKSVAFDPTEQYLVSASEDNTVRVFELHADTLSATEKAQFRVYYDDIRDEDVRCRCAWQPSGNSRLLAVPSVNPNTVELMQCSNWKSTGQLALPVGRGTSAPINLVAFSPNGLYLAAVTMAKELFVWTISSKECIRSWKVEYMPLSLKWARGDNALVVFHAGGKVAFVKDAIPQGLTPPHGLGLASVDPSRPSGKQLETTKNPRKFIEDEAEEDRDPTGNDATEDDDSEARVEAIKASFGFGSSTDGHATLPDDDEDPHGDNEAVVVAKGSRGLAAAATWVKPFQSGATPEGSGSVHLLAWTPIGEVECIRGASLSENIVKVEFTDKSRRGFKFNDNYMFSMAYLDDHGAIFASPRRAREEWDLVDNNSNGVEGDLISSFVFYRPFESWASNSAWHISLPDAEDAECVACAQEFCAVATSLQCVRVYTTSGLEYALWRVPNRIVTMAARGNHLAVVYLSPTGLYDGSLSFQLLRITVSSALDRVEMVVQGDIPLCPPPADPFASPSENERIRNDRSVWSRLKWLGFDDRDILYTVDSFGCVHALAAAFGWQWFPIASVGNALIKKPEERHGIFTLGVVNSSLLYFPLERGASAPRLRGKHRPVPSSLAFQHAQFPKMSGSASSAAKKADTPPNLMWYNSNLWALSNHARSVHASARDRHERVVVQEKAEMDKALILMMKTACTNDEPARVLDLAKCLHLEKSHQIAQKLAVHYGLRQLQTQLYDLYEAQFVHVAQDDEPMERPFQSKTVSSAPRNNLESRVPLSGDHDRPTASSRAVLGRVRSRATTVKSIQEATEHHDSDDECEGSEPARVNDTPEASADEDEPPHSTAEDSSQRRRGVSTVQKDTEKVRANTGPPVNPFLKKPSTPSAQDSKKKAGLERLALFKSPPSKKHKR